MQLRVLAIAAAVVALLAPPAVAQQKSRLLTVQESGTLRVGTTGDFNPMSYRNPATRELEGHQIDAAKELARQMGVKVEFVPTTWQTLINGLNANQYDIVMTGTSMSVARAKAVGFTMPWGRNAFVPLALKTNEGKYRNWGELNDSKVTVAVNLGTTMEQFVQKELPKANFRRVEAPARDWQELLAGRVDVTISSLIEAAFLTKEYPQLVVLFREQPKNVIPMSFLVPIDDHVWLNFINNWIVINQAEGFFDRIGKEWKLVVAD
jgi:cyclohexadienyl dehydratase